MTKKTGYIRNAVDSNDWKIPNHPIDGRLQSEVQVWPDKLEVVASFCYLCDILSAWKMSVNRRSLLEWKPPGRSSGSYKQFSHSATSLPRSQVICTSLVRGAMLHASKICPLTKPNIQQLQRNDWALIRQICNIKPKAVAMRRLRELLAKLELKDIDFILR